MQEQIIGMLLGGMKQLKMYGGALFGALVLVNIIAPIAVTCLFVICAAALLSSYYLDERKIKKDLMKGNAALSDEELEVKINGGVLK